MVMNMKKHISCLRLNMSLLFIMVLLSSCLTNGLDELESFTDTKITNVKFEHRWIRQITSSTGLQLEQLAVVAMTTNCDFKENTINCTITVPEVGNPSMFTEDVRNKVSLSSIVGMVSISTAATIKPLEGSPIFGDLGDFTTARKYLVTAADGKTKKEWTIICTMIKK